MEGKEVVKKKGRFKVPHTFVIIFSLVCILAILTYIIPAGQYDTYLDEQTGKTLIDPDSYHAVEQSPVGLLDLFQSITTGMQQGSSIVFFVLLIGGAFGVINATGALDTAVSHAAIRMRKKDKLLMAVLMLIFFLMGILGLSDQCMVFIPLVVFLVRALGYDAMVGCAVVWLAGSTGFNAGVLNPFSVGVAQSIAGLPMYSGMTFRWIMGAVLITVTYLYILRYCKKLKADPTSSAVLELEEAEHDMTLSLDNISKMTISDILIVIALVIGIVILVIGSVKWNWGIDRIAAEFILLSVICGALAKMSPSKICEEFMNGAKTLLFGALVIGLARAALVVMTQGNIIHPIIHFFAGVLDSLPRSLTAVGMYIVHIIINFFIPSGSGQAAATMPIMIPLGDLLGIERQLSVLAFQLGDGFTNSIIPTAGVLMAALSIAKIPYEKWVKWLWPLMLIWLGLGIVFIIIASVIGYA